MTVLAIVGDARNGEVIDGLGQRLSSERDAVVIRSQFVNDRWVVPSDITIRNFSIRGGVRLYGMGINGQAPLVKLSSTSEGHTERCQAAAPRRIVFEDCYIEADGRVPFYVGPGCTEIVLRRCWFHGKADSTVVYLDCESAYNVIEECSFATRTTKREVIAVDGSAHNVIQYNRFVYSTFGGIYVYRNAGEGGTVRHQAPQHNVIAHNRFAYRTTNMFIRIWRAIFPSIWIGSRSSWITSLFRLRYRDDDAGYPFGSSIDNKDQAFHNTVIGNLPEGLVRVVSYYPYRDTL